MDIRCKRCGEPWDEDTISTEVSERQRAGETATYQQVAAEFRRWGCAAFREFTGNRDLCRGDYNPALAAIYDVCGDDMDGAAALIEDAEALGLID